jgi:hypothetical protein
VCPRGPQRGQKNGAFQEPKSAMTVENGGFQKWKIRKMVDSENQK